MSDDIRLQSDWYQNPKIKKLSILTGAQGIVSLLTLWAWTGRNRPNGVLHDMDELDIALAANWPNDATLFIDSLLRLRLLDAGECYSIHDWEGNQPWAMHTGARKAAARKAAYARWGKGEEISEVSTSCDPHENLCATHVSGCKSHESALRNAPKTDAPYLSLPTPSPTPHQETTPPTPQGGVCTEPPSGKPARRSKTASPKTTIPENFTISENVKRWADKKGFPQYYLEANFEKFVNYVEKEAKTYANWDRALMDAVDSNWAKASLNSSNQPTTNQAGVHNGYQSKPRPESTSDILARTDAALKARFQRENEASQTIRAERDISDVGHRVAG